jgi:hypothetical protein
LNYSRWMTPLIYIAFPVVAGPVSRKTIRSTPLERAWERREDPVSTKVQTGYHAGASACSHRCCTPPPILLFRPSLCTRLTHAPPIYIYIYIYIYVCVCVCVCVGWLWEPFRWMHVIKGRTNNVIPDSHQLHKFFLQCWQAGRLFRYRRVCQADCGRYPRMTSHMQTGCQCACQSSKDSGALAPFFLPGVPKFPSYCFCSNIHRFVDHNMQSDKGDEIQRGLCRVLAIFVTRPCSKN